MTWTMSSQNINVQNMINYLRSKDYPKAKAAADAAAEHESTSKSPKMWMYRGSVYKAIADTSARDMIDPEADEKALDAYINCLKLDKDSVYKPELKFRIVPAAAGVRNKAAFYKQSGKADMALKCYDLLEAALPYDFSGGIKRNNITKEKIMYERYDLYKFLKDYPKQTEAADKLIAINYKDPRVFTDMVQVSLNVKKDTAAALGYIEKGKKLFEDNMTLIATEIDIYIAQKKIGQLKDKLIKAIEYSPDNEVLYAVLGQVYDKTGDPENAEKQYLKAVELKPESETMNYKVGAMYFNRANDYNNKLSDLPPKEVAKAKEYEQKVQEYFKKAVPYLETAYGINQDKAYKQRLLQAYTRLGDTEKAAKYK
jgi:tetratricopeptide (TPR) repeat protein